MAICEDCGEDHDSPEVLADVTRKVKFRYRLYAALFLTAILIALSGVFIVLGLGGLVLGIGVVLAHFSHINLRVMNENLQILKEAARPAKHMTMPKIDTSGNYL